MAVLAVVASGPEESWQAVLRAAIRPEFAVERYVAEPGDVLFAARSARWPVVALRRSSPRWSCVWRTGPSCAAARS